MKSFMALSVLAVVLVLTGCATGQQFSTVQSGLAPIAQGKGRVFIYRSTSVGFGIQPDIRLNGEVVGSAKPNGIFYVDHDPGNIEIVIGTEVEKRLTFTLAAGEARYVKCTVGFGVLVARIIPVLVDAQDATKEVTDLAYTGSK